LAKYKEQQKQYEERIAKSNARANAEVKKKIGKQIMFRSPPVNKRLVKQEQLIKRVSGNVRICCPF